MNKSIFFTGLLTLLFFTCAIVFSGEDNVFYDGRHLGDLRTVKITKYHRIKHGILSACAGVPTPVAGALIREGKCYILDASRTDNDAMVLPPWAGDKYILYKGKGIDDIANLKFPILKGAGAIKALVELEANRSAEKSQSDESAKIDAAKEPNKLSK